MEEKEIIKGIINDIVTKIMFGHKPDCAEKAKVETPSTSEPSFHEYNEPWSGITIDIEAPEYVSPSQNPFGAYRRGIPPPRLPEKLRNLDTKSELYLNEEDNQDEIIINVPDKYKNYKISQLGDAMLMKFLSEIHKIREEKLSLKGITLSRIPVLHIYDPNSE